MKKPQLVILGPPLCGKTVQSDLLRRKFEISYLSTGAIFREAIARGTELGIRIKRIVDEGRFVPDDIVLATVNVALERLRLENGILLDGFPRTLPQATYLEDFLLNKSANLDRVIVLEVSEQEILRRLQKRREKERRRDDESEDAVRTRLEIYGSLTIPVLSYYENRGIVSHIDGERSIDEVFGDIVRSVEASD